jgi:hypothetical protein
LLAAQAGKGSLKAALAACVASGFLNPHVCLDGNAACPACSRATAVRVQEWLPDALRLVQLEVVASAGRGTGRKHMLDIVIAAVVDHDAVAAVQAALLRIEVLRFVVWRSAARIAAGPMDRYCSTSGAYCDRCSVCFWLSCCTGAP